MRRQRLATNLFLIFFLLCVVALWRVGSQQPASPQPVASDRPAQTDRAPSVLDEIDEPVEAPAPVEPVIPPRTVVWLSVDGLRPDYIDRAETPFFDWLIANGAWSRQLEPVFPSLTFPSHVSQATGVLVEDHGIPLNAFVDREDWSIHRYPDDDSLLEAEPIWITAVRQGKRSLVFDWPLSSKQQGLYRATYHHERFITEMKDEERLTAALDLWEADHADPPLRLIMAYMIGPDRAGHRYGPNAPEMVEVMEETDRLVGRFFARARDLWRDQHPESELVFLVTTDHGMTEVHTLVSLDHMIARPADDEELFTITGGNVGHVFLRDRSDEFGRDPRVDAILAAAERFPFATAYEWDEMPPRWGYAHPTRVGDVVIVLDPGYTFSRRPKSVSAPVDMFDGPLGMHGYHPDRSPEMLGFMAVWSSDEKFGGLDLGDVDSLQLHPTVAEWLKIQPSEQAMDRPLQIGERAASSAHRD